jgi:hypothetical protein
VDFWCGKRNKNTCEIFQVAGLDYEIELSDIHTEELETRHKPQIGRSMTEAKTTPVEGAAKHLHTELTNVWGRLCISAADVGSAECHELVNATQISHRCVGNKSSLKALIGLTLFSYLHQELLLQIVTVSVGALYFISGIVAGSSRGSVGIKVPNACDENLDFAYTNFVLKNQLEDTGKLVSTFKLCTFKLRYHVETKCDDASPNDVLIAVTVSGDYVYVHVSTKKFVLIDLLEFSCKLK